MAERPADYRQRLVATPASSFGVTATSHDMNASRSSSETVVVDARQTKLVEWLARLPRYGIDVSTLRAASADASFRRYFRVDAAGRSLIAMDAPPEREDIGPFIRVASLLRAAGINAPEVLEVDSEQGFLLLTDADITCRTDALRMLVARAEREGYYLTSLMAKLRCVSLAERALVPAFVFFFQTLYPFAWVNRRDRKVAAAAGGTGGRGSGRAGSARVGASRSGRDLRRPGCRARWG